MVLRQRREVFNVPAWRRTHGGAAKRSPPFRADVHRRESNHRRTNVATTSAPRLQFVPVDRKRSAQYGQRSRRSPATARRGTEKTHRMRSYQGPPLVLQPQVTRESNGRNLSCSPKANLSFPAKVWERP